MANLSLYALVVSTIARVDMSMKAIHTRRIPQACCSNQRAIALTSWLLLASSSEVIRA